METYVSEDGIYLVTAHAQTSEHYTSICLEVHGGVDTFGNYMTHYATAPSLDFGDGGSRCGVNLAFEVPIREGESVFTVVRVLGNEESWVDVSLTVDWRAPCTIPPGGSG